MAEYYETPLCTRYASEEMKRIFSSDEKYSTWRKLWVYLAESEKELGLNITDGQIAEMKEHIFDIDYAKVAEYENKIRHDVMAHLKAYCDQCPTARPIIHLGATSCYVGDNTDIIVIKNALLRVKSLLLRCIDAVKNFALKYKATPTLAYTHFQSAQPTTVGKRAVLWLQDLIFDLENLNFTVSKLRLLGCKGTTGTGASFLALFDGNVKKVEELEKKIAEKAGFTGCYPVSGQTYSRKIDYFVLSVLSGLAQSAAKFSSDIRLLSHLKEFDEPFEDGQVGSSAMPYKRNPMRSERIASLCRYVIIDALNPAVTAASQWFERTLDDSANKRISVPEAFLAIDGILELYINIIENGVFYPKMAEKHLMEEYPFMATENILMYCVEKGGDRQILHEKIRKYAVSTAKEMKLNGKDNDILNKIVADRDFGITEEELKKILTAGSITGCAEKQTEDYIKNYVEPVLQAEKYEKIEVKINV